MYSDWSVFAIVAIAVVFTWLAGLSYFSWKQNKFLRSLFPKSGERDIRKKFEEVISGVDEFKEDLSDVNKKIDTNQTQGLQHIQRVDLLRYNPYNDTGGDQSFTACFLNNEGSGIVITSLHARSETRVFGKEVILGKSSKYQLSKEEELVIKKAMEK